MKLSSCRVVRFNTQPAKNQRVLPQMCSRSNPPIRTTHRNHRENEQTRRVPGQMRHCRRAHRHQHRRSRPATLMFSKLQKRPRQRRRSRRNSQRYSIPRPYQREKMCRTSARTICAPDQNRSSRRAHQRPRHRNRPVVPMFSKPQRRSCQHRQSRRNSRRRSIPQRPRQRQKIHRVSARTIYAPGQKQSRRRAYQRQRHKSRVVAPM